MDIQPLYDRVLVRSFENKGVSAGGILLPGDAKEKPIRGEVIAVGTGKNLDNGNVRKLKVKVGDKIFYGTYAGVPVNVDDEELLMMREDDIMGTYTE